MNVIYTRPQSSRYLPANQQSTDTNTLPQFVTDWHRGSRTDVLIHHTLKLHYFQHTFIQGGETLKLNFLLIRDFFKLLLWRKKES